MPMLLRRDGDSVAGTAEAPGSYPRAMAAPKPAPAAMNSRRAIEGEGDMYFMGRPYLRKSVHNVSQI